MASTIIGTPIDYLRRAWDTIVQRGTLYDGTGQPGDNIEDNFSRAAQLASIRLQRYVHPYEIAVVLESVKQARTISAPDHMDNYVDRISYVAFEASMALDYAIHTGRTTNVAEAPRPTDPASSGVELAP